MARSRVPDVVAAAVAALRADSTLTGLMGSVVKVYTHVPQGTDPPYVAVLGGDEVPWATSFATGVASPLDASSDGGDWGGRMVDVIASCVSTYRGSEEVDGIASRVLEILTDPDSWATTAMAGVQAVDFVRNTAFQPVDLFADGKLWFQRTVVARVTVG